jgi:hypothetical protein
VHLSTACRVRLLSCELSLPQVRLRRDRDVRHLSSLAGDREVVELASAGGTRRSAGEADSALVVARLDQGGLGLLWVSALRAPTEVVGGWHSLTSYVALGAASEVVDG